MQRRTLHSQQHTAPLANLQAEASGITMTGHHQGHQPTRPPTSSALSAMILSSAAPSSVLYPSRSSCCISATRRTSSSSRPSVLNSKWSCCRSLPTAASTSASLPTTSSPCSTSSSPLTHSARRVTPAKRAATPATRDVGTGSSADSQVSNTTERQEAARGCMPMSSALTTAGSMTRAARHACRADSARAAVRAVAGLPTSTRMPHSALTVSSVARASMSRSCGQTGLEFRV